MALKIKLARFGKKGNPTYRIVAIDESSRRQGKEVDILGTYNPKSKDEKIVIDNAKLKKWFSVGAKPTDGIRKLLSL